MAWTIVRVTPFLLHTNGTTLATESTYWYRLNNPISSIRGSTKARSTSKIILLLIGTVAMRLLALAVAGFLLSFVRPDGGLAALAAEPPAQLGPKAPLSADLLSIRSLLATPYADIDLATAKLAIDHIVDPQTDVRGTLQEIDALVSSVRSLVPAGAPSNQKLGILTSFLYKPGPWNDFRPFSYDLDDPLGRNIRNQFLAGYLDTRKGNCISMPILYAILGQRLGLEVTLARAPTHLFVKYRDDGGKWHNFEATSGGFKRDSSYQRELAISMKAIANGVYLRPLNRREAIAAMLTTLLEFYGKRGRQADRIILADLVLAASPREVSAMLHKGNAYYRILQQRYLSQYASPRLIPPTQRPDFERLSRSNWLWFQKAEALGWVEPTPEQDAAYLRMIEHAKQTEQGQD